MSKDTWAGMDPDDVSGYLLDYLNGEMSDEKGEPLDDEALGYRFGLHNADEKLVELVFELRNAVRAKAADFDE